jgi:uncharacterized protein (TIGR04255 family)
MPPQRKLAKKPLVEAILEAHWVLQPGPTPDTKRDPNYKFLLGTLFGAVRTAYPHHEELPAASVPEELTPYIVHHRFRAEPGGWPLLQVGPGVFTVNETTGYDWETFEQRINAAIPMLVDAYPKREDLKFETLMLRYINAVPVNLGETNVLAFLSDKMGTQFSLPTSIFEGGMVSVKPIELATQFVFPCKDPDGALLLKFGTGKRGAEPAVIFELWFTSRGPHVPSMPDEFLAWASSAHQLIERTFFGLIAGDLEKEFTEHV